MLGNALYGPFLVLSLSNLFRLGYFEIGVIIVLLTVFQLPFFLLGGFASDRFGRRPLILLGLAGEATVTAVLAYGFLTQALDLVLVDAFVGGTLGATCGPAFSAYIADLSAGSVRTRAYTWYRIAFNAGYSAGVALGGILVAAWGFGGAVAAASVIIGFTAIALLLELRPSPYDERLASGRAAPREAPSPPGPAPRRHGLGESLRAMGRDPAVLEVAIAFTLGSFIASQWGVIFPLFVHNVLGIGYSLLGVGLALNGLVVVFGQSSTTSWAIGRRHTSLAALGLALYAAAFLGLGAAGTFLIFPTAVFFVAVVVLTVGENVAAIPAGTLPSNLAPEEDRGSYNGAFQLFGQIGFLASTLAGTSVLAITSSPLLIWAILTLPAVPAIVLFRVAAARIPASADTA